MGKLDLKFIVHHGEYVTQTIADRRELTGPDVILVHRLVKNDVAEQTGISSYALFTSAAVDALGLAELKDDAHSYAVDLDEFGHIEGVVVDFGDRWKSHFAQSEIVVSDSELWLEPISRVLPFNIETVWTLLWHPDLRTRWNSYVDSTLRVKGDPKRLRVGTVDHCAHGKQTFILRYIDVRPLKHVTIEYPTPMGGHLRRSIQLSPDGEGTRITIKWAQAQGPNPLATALLRFIGGLRYKKRFQDEGADELRMLEDFIAEQADAGGRPGDAPISLSDDAIKDAARELAAGQA